MKEREIITRQLVDQQARETATSIMAAFVLAKPNPPPKEMIQEMIAAHISRIVKYVDIEPLNCLQLALQSLEKCDRCRKLREVKMVRSFLTQFDLRLVNLPPL